LVVVRRGSPASSNDQAGQQFLEEDRHLHPRQMHAQALVRAVAEGDVPVRLAVGAERERVVEGVLVAVAGRKAERHLLALGDGLAAHLGVTGRDADELIHRRRPADRLLDQARDQAWVGLDLGQFRRPLGQRPEAAGDRRRGGVVPGEGDGDVVAERVRLGQQFAVDAAVGDHAGEVVGRLAPAIGGDGAEVVADLGDGLHQAAGDLLGRHGSAPGQLRVVVAEVLLGQPQHHRLVLGRHAQDRHHHQQRIVHRDIAHEVDLAAGRGHQVDVAARQVAHAVLELADVLGREPGLGEQAVLDVFRLVHADHAAEPLRLAADLAAIALVASAPRPLRKTSFWRAIAWMSSNLEATQNGA
jgi:hypothetical protein